MAHTSQLRSGRGYTLIEIGVVIGLLAVLMAIVIPSVGALTGAQLRTSSNMMTGLVREAYARAAITGKPHRIVFDIDQGAFWLERSEDRFVLPGEKLRADAHGRGGQDLKDREEAANDAVKRRMESMQGPGGALDPMALMGMMTGGAGNIESLGQGALGGLGGTPMVSGLSADDDMEEALKNRLRRQADFLPVGDELGKPQLLKSDVRFHRIWIEHQSEPFTAGSSELYFFPMGFTERAHITLSDDEHGERALTVVVNPLTARARVTDEELEEPWR